MEREKARSWGGDLIPLAPSLGISYSDRYHQRQFRPVKSANALNISNLETPILTNPS
jgi:hypothetical protein